MARTEPCGDGVRLTITAATVLADLGLGASIAVDGVCQTVVDLSADTFAVQTIASTLGRTTLGGYVAGRRVNLERALALGARLGGHLVQGHVDAVGRVLRLERRQEMVLVDFTMPPDVAEVTVLHGSITLNGISLTVNALPEPGVCQVAIIPHTWRHTNLEHTPAGAAVNLEGDTIGKYVRQLLRGPAEPDLRRRWGYNTAEGISG